MALTWTSRGRGPRTHVLIVGVGGYDHLPEGRGELTSNPLKFGNLGQLRSPPRSALRLLDWLIESDHHGWKAPLGTIDVLISRAPGDQLDRDDDRFEYASHGRIKAAFDSWYRRCDRHSDNVAILYVCGHGLESDEHVFLPADIGRPGPRPWEHAIGVDSTIRGLQHCKAETQIVMVDTCREVTNGILRTPDLTGGGLAGYSDQDLVRAKYPLAIKATSRNARAFAPPGGRPTHFVQALLRGLDGEAADEGPQGRWEVKTDDLASAMFRLVEREAAAGPTPQVPDPRPGLPTVLYRPPRPPRISFKIGCSPTQATGEARLRCRSVGDGSVNERDPADEPWVLELEAGYYDVGASFDTDRYTSVERRCLARPRVAACDLVVE